MPNPADNYTEVDQSFYVPNSKGDHKAVEEFLGALRRECKYQAIITDLLDSSKDKITYLVDVYRSGYNTLPDIKDAKMFRVLGANSESLLPLKKFTPTYVKETSGGFIMVEEDMSYYLELSEDWKGGAGNKLMGWPAAGPITYANGANKTQDRIININLMYPFASVVGDPLTPVPNQGMIFYGANTRIQSGSIVPFKRYDTFLHNAPFIGTPPAGVTPDPITGFDTIGLALLQHPLPYGTGKYLIMQIIDDLGPGTLGFDSPKFP